MNPILGFGALVGLGLWWAWTGWSPAVQPLAQALARFGQPNAPTTPVTRDTLDDHLGAQMRRLGLVEQVLERHRADLRIMRRSPDDQAARIGAYTLLGLFAGALAAFPRYTAGLPVPVALAACIGIVGAAAGSTVPLLDLRDKAAARRTSLVHALSAYCGFVEQCFAAGFGVEQSLETAAAAGHGWQFDEIRSALTSGRIKGVTPWDALGHLGQELAVTDLVELSAAVGLAGEEGAAVRETIAGKARTIRERLTADTEREAARVTVRMSLPATVLLLGFLIVLVYPAAVAVSGAL